MSPNPLLTIKAPKSTPQSVLGACGTPPELSLSLSVSLALSLSLSFSLCTLNVKNRRALAAGNDEETAFEAKGLAALTREWWRVRGLGFRGLGV